MLSRRCLLSFPQFQAIRNFSNASNSEVRLERLTGNDQGISVIVMNRAAKRNSLGREFMKQLQNAVDELKFDQKTRVVVLKSDVEGTFCAGADLKERREMNHAESNNFVELLRTSFTNIERLPQPVIAAVNGFAFGGGLELALACDIRVAAKKAKMGLIETKWALLPGAGGSQRLMRTIGVGKAKEMIFTAKVIDGEEAERIGIANYAVEDAYEKALEIAREILPRGPIAVRLAKTAMNLGKEVDITSGLNVEQQCYAQLVPSKDRQEGMAAFAEKREPKYKGE